MNKGKKGVIFTSVALAVFIAAGALIFCFSNKDTSEDKTDSGDLSAQPEITVATAVASDTFIIGGICSKETESIDVAGQNVTPQKVMPFCGGDKKYFLANVKAVSGSKLSLTATETGKAASAPVERYLMDGGIIRNYMTEGEYTPYIGKDSQMHFYSAILSHTTSADKLTEQMLNEAKANIESIVDTAKNAGAEPIFLIIPSSAEIYPETLPDEFKKAEKSVFDSFKALATDAGAKVIYPLDTMLNHKNDGDGYRLYQHTDSHWSTYGAYWGTYDLFGYISESFPAAAPRSLEEMSFYTTAMYGGDALFNFPKNIGFEDNRKAGKAETTKIKELTTLYKLETPTNTLEKVYNNFGCLYLTEDNAKAATVENKNGEGLPSTVIMRDSFGKVAYDMLADRFSVTHFGEFNNYNLPKDKLNDVDYVIYVYSERNLLKIMLNNSNANLLTLK